VILKLVQFPQQGETNDYVYHAHAQSIYSHKMLLIVHISHKLKRNTFNQLILQQWVKLRMQFSIRSTGNNQLQCLLMWSNFILVIFVFFVVFMTALPSVPC